MIARKGFTSSLRYKVLLEKPVRVSDGAGGYSITWEMHCNLWAAITSGSGRERFAFGKNSPSYTHKFRIRYLASIREEMRLNFNGRLFNIRAIINVDEESKIMDIYAEEGAAL